MFMLCVLAVGSAIGGLGAVGLALGTTAGLGHSALLAAPAFGAISLSSGLAAAIVAMRRHP